ncbi:peptidoglycan DD-metalloendopeptidase family protein [Sporosarcina jiandibaonis]|uniref:peptidoglycan DD-metalloendopeptidase family protein n=1 Tax=Sporosarcina jiandibaonis TaxID=2715535 RepID=UPI0015543592|nr:peptidoglycan DD-metalloendopeptidase family protein [Sporosarcina jiandibaonis]
MRWRVKWVVAVLFTVSVIGVAKLESAGMIGKSVTQYVTTGEDFLTMKKWVSSMINEPEDDTTIVSHEGGLLPTYESMQPFKNGVLVSYAVPIAIQAQADGIVVFTGSTRDTGKTVTVLYDDGDEVTYGFVGKFEKLPYTSVKKGDTLALMDEEAIYIMVKRDGIHLDSSLLPAYLSGSVE